MWEFFMKVSVIIAAYNSAEFVVETLESVLNQTLEDFEIIIVNDGSTDNTLEILNDYASNYDKITVIDQENSGPAMARNRGLDIAKGDFIFFFDADDILELDALEEMYNAAVKRNADLVIAKYDIFNQFKTIHIKNIDDLVCKKEIYKYDPLIIWTYSLSNKLFRHSVIKEHNFRLADIDNAEDGEFMIRFMLNCNKITGLDKVVFHYRKLVLGQYGSITSFVNYKKVDDYIKAHNLILNSVESSILRDFPKYDTLEEAKRDNAEIMQYVNEIIRKEIHLLLDQMYTKFWNSEEETIKLIVDEINSKLKLLDIKSISKLKELHSEMSLNNICFERGKVLDSACITAVLFATENQKDEFLECLNSLVVQNLINIKIVIPEYLKDEVVNSGIYQENIVFDKADSKDDFYNEQLSKATTEYIAFCDPKFIYFTNAFRSAYRFFKKYSPDFISELVYHSNYGEIQPVTVNKIAFNQLKGGSKKFERLCCDRTLHNKFFNVEFLKNCLKGYSGPIIDKLEDFYGSGYFNFNNTGNVIFNDLNERFIDYIATSDSRKHIESYLEEDKSGLDSNVLKTRSVETFPKLLKYKNINLKNILKNIVISLYKNKKVKDRVLFYSNRTHGKLSGNSKAVYPYINCKKIIAAKTHFNIFDELSMIKKIMTSKVIVADDYVRYLRYIALKPEQRVIQLWHACGAFKKFGQRGTNMAISTDLASHAQYNLVSVSSDYIRSIYADAFDVDIRKVRAIGCPSTDKFLNNNVKNKIINKIYKQYPEFKDKSVIIYAPTFRDAGKGRNEFVPQIDFDELSKQLLPNQLFLICPHPVMKNKIVEKEYSNIKVIRDFSTDNLMMISDMLITDYSSVIFQYSLLNKPMAFYCYDFDSYNRDFYLNYPDDLPGEVFKTQQELTDFITNTKNFSVSDKQKAFFDKYMSACDGNSSKRIADLINSYVGVKK